MPWRQRLLLMVVGLVLVTGCSVPIASQLDEHDANQVVVALEAKGIAASKELDPGAEGRWQVSVDQDDASAAVAVLSHEGLPAPPSPGVLEALGKQSIVPSRTAEHAKLVAGTAGELERSLREVDGVLSARVHLAVPPKNALEIEEQKTQPTASVLLRHRGATPPIAEADVQHLVAGAVPGLAPEHVSVVTAPVPPAPRMNEHELARFGPLTLTRQSMPRLRWIAGGGLLFLIGLMGVVLYGYSRLRRGRNELADAHAAAEARDAR